MNSKQLSKSLDTSRNDFYDGCNKEGRMLDNQTIIELLDGLLQHPSFFSFIEQHLADELEHMGYFSLETFSVTALGRDYLASHTLNKNY
jgi:hypothetical protein